MTYLQDNKTKSDFEHDKHTRLHTDICNILLIMGRVLPNNPRAQVLRSYRLLATVVYGNTTLTFNGIFWVFQQ